jgi:glycosyltransferase involved in cell wall biosynthesis
MSNLAEVKKIRLAWLATHPIQYQSPLLREIALVPEIDLTAIFFSNFSTKSFIDKEFGLPIAWDTSLLDGYKHLYLPGSEEEISEIKTFQPKISGITKYLNKKHFDVVLVQGWNHYGMVLAAWLAKRAGLKVLLRCEATDHVSSSRGLKGWFRERVIQFLLSQVDFCMAIGTNNRKFYLDRGVPANKIGFMPYCVDNDFFRLHASSADLDQLRNSLGLDPGRAVLLYASKFIKRKFPDVLLDAYSQLKEPRPYLLYVGDGELANDLKARVHELGLSDVRFLEFQNQSQLPKYYALADIFVLTSMNETWGLVVNEAMNAGCAIIVTDSVGSSADLVRDQINGIVLPSLSKDLLVTALNRCLANQAYIEMGENSLEIIKGWGIKECISGLVNPLEL